MSIKLKEGEAIQIEMPNGALIRVEARSPEELIIQRENLPRELTVVVNSFPNNHVLHSMFIAVQTKNYK
jgi:hypothetical protein